jgi:F0F1-type ATP synthase alpha subunit
MSSTKRPNKRSLVGLRVAAKRDSGFYEAGSVIDTTSKLIVGPDNLTSSLSISASSSFSSQGHKVLISFDDGTKHWYSERHIIGSGKELFFLLFALTSSYMPTYWDDL